MQVGKQLGRQAAVGEGGKSDEKEGQPKQEIMKIAKRNVICGQPIKNEIK